MGETYRKKTILLLLLTGFIATSFAQTNTGKSFRITSSHSMFPDSLRNAEPRVYDNKTYTATEHYTDSSAYIFVPAYFDKTKPFHFIFWFHGWGNNIDSALIEYKLKEQFNAAHLNAIFIFPEGPRNAPDSYGGKFEEAGVFNLFVKDILEFLTKEKIISSKDRPVDLVYAGHSGAYRVMSYLLVNSSYTCKAILLFDALYGQQEKFVMYLQQQPSCKMINIYTDNGGTMQNSKDLMMDMDAWKWKYILKQDEEITAGDLKNNRLIFIHSNVEHNAVVTHYNNFQRFLEALR
jgi:hypothetical protein